MKRLVSKLVLGVLAVVMVICLMPTGLKSEARSTSSRTTVVRNSSFKMSGGKGYVTSYPTNDINNSLAIIPSNLSKVPLGITVQLEYTPRKKYMFLVDTTSAMAAVKATSNIKYAYKLSRGGYTYYRQQTKLERVYLNGRFYFAVVAIPSTDVPQVALYSNTSYKCQYIQNPKLENLQLHCKVQTKDVDSIIRYEFTVYGATKKIATLKASTYYEGVTVQSDNSLLTQTLCSARLDLSTNTNVTVYLDVYTVTGGVSTVYVGSY